MGDACSLRAVVSDEAHLVVEWQVFNTSCVISIYYSLIYGFVGDLISRSNYASGTKNVTNKILNLFLK